MNQPTIDFARKLAGLASTLADAADTALIGGIESVEGAAQAVYEMGGARHSLVVSAAAALRATRAEEAESDKVIDRGLAALKTALSGTCPRCGEPTTRGGMFHENCPGSPLAAALADAAPAYGANEHARAAGKIADPHADLPHCSTPGWEETGEVRVPRRGEWYVVHWCGHAVQASCSENGYTEPRRILRRVEVDANERGVYPSEVEGAMPEGDQRG